METQELLNQRNDTHGPFTGNAEIAQELKNVIHKTHNWNCVMTDVHREALDMICHKIARICNGDPFFDDHFDDIAGYAQLPKKFNHGKQLDLHESSTLQ